MTSRLQQMQDAANKLWAQVKDDESREAFEAFREAYIEYMRVAAVCWRAERIVAPTKAEAVALADARAAELFAHVTHRSTPRTIQKGAAVSTWVYGYCKNEWTEGWS